MAKFVLQKVRLIEEPSITKKIELAGRTCYKSNDKIKEGSDIKFCSQMIKSGHEAMVEFGTVIAKVNEHAYFRIKEANNKYLNLSSFRDDKTRYIISGNIRGWRNFIKSGNCSANIKQYVLMKFINDENINILFKDIPWDHTVNISDTVFNFEFMNDTDLLKEEKEIHKYYHFVIETSRGIMAELTRHRPASFACQSTRYVNYKDGVEFVKPRWYDQHQKTFTSKLKHFFRKREWKISCNESEKRYKRIISLGGKPQEAREVLNNSTKTIINISCNLEEYRWIFKLRCDKSAHPDIRYISKWMNDIITMDLDRRTLQSNQHISCK